MITEEEQLQINIVAQSASNIPGWLWPREIGALYHQTTDSKLHVEIGSFCGKSLYVTAAAMNGGKIIAVDPLTAEYLPGRSSVVPDNQWCQNILRSTIKAIHRNFDTEVEWWPITSMQAVQKAIDLSLEFDSCFIDGNHNKAECEADIKGWAQLIKAGGRVLGHDYYPNFISVVDAVNEFYQDDFVVIPETRIWAHHKK